jgi:hypothetical protein
VLISFDIHYVSKGYLSKYHNWNIRSKFTCPGSEKYSKRSYRIKVTPKPPPTSLPSVPLLMQLRKEAHDCFDMTRDPNLSKSSFGYICSSVLVSIIILLVCLLHIPRCMHTKPRNLKNTTDSHLVLSNGLSCFEFDIGTVIFPDFSCMFGMRLLSSWFLNCFHAVLPLYVLITPNKGLQAESSLNLNTSKTDEVPIWLLEERRKARESKQRQKANINRV